MGQNFRVPIRSWKTAMVISGCNLNSCYGGTTSLRARSPERTGGGRENPSARAPKRDKLRLLAGCWTTSISGPFYIKSFVTPLPYHRNGLNNLGPVPRKMIKFNPGLSQILGKVFVWEHATRVYCLAFLTPRYSNDNTKCYSKQYTGR